MRLHLCAMLAVDAEIKNSVQNNFNNLNAEKFLSAAVLTIANELMGVEEL